MSNMVMPGGIPTLCDCKLVCVYDHHKELAWMLVPDSGMAQNRQLGILLRTVPYLIAVDLRTIS
ncbi:hypothetical protein NIES4103_62770 [Nostoc sp. NIES-4103]|nr:hypothetical protein NIES4103_62770 [Nostoc sp. NIES-4103]